MPLPTAAPRHPVTPHQARSAAPAVSEGLLAAEALIEAAADVMTLAAGG